MNDFLLISYLILVTAVLIIQVIIKKPTNLEQIQALLIPTIEFFSPIGVFILGFLGLRQWKREFTFRSRNKLSEEIALSLLEFKNAIYEIRNNWPIAYASDAKWSKVMSKEDEFFNAPTFVLSFYFSEQTQEDLQSKTEVADKKKDDLEQKLKIARILWNEPDIEKSADSLFKLYFDTLNAVSRIRRDQGIETWSFRGKEIEENQDLALILHFAFRTENKTTDELNAPFKQRLDLCSNKILEKISKYIY